MAIGSFGWGGFGCELIVVVVFGNNVEMESIRLLLVLVLLHRLPSNDIKPAFVVPTED